MFKHIKGTIIFSMILFLAGIFCFVFSQNEINATIGLLSNDIVQELNIAKTDNIRIKSNIPVNFHSGRADKLYISVQNVNTDYLKISENPDNTLTIDYQIANENMNVLFLPLINVMKRTTPQISIFLPENYEIYSMRNNGNYSFNLLFVFEQPHNASDINFRIGLKGEYENSTNIEPYAAGEGVTSYYIESAVDTAIISDTPDLKEERIPEITTFSD